MELCLPCLKKQLEYKKQILKFKKASKSTKKKKPELPDLCLECRQYIDMHTYLNKHRKYVTYESGKERQQLNSIVSCGYGMFAPKFYKKNVIDKRRY